MSKEELVKELRRIVGNTSLTDEELILIFKECHKEKISEIDDFISWKELKGGKELCQEKHNSPQTNNSLIRKRLESDSQEEIREGSLHPVCNSSERTEDKTPSETPNSGGADAQIKPVEEDAR